MKPQGRAVSIAATALLIVIIALAAAVAIVLYAQQPPPSRQASSEASTQSPSGENASSVSVFSPNGLRLTLNLSQSVVPQEGGVSVSVSLFNTLPTENSPNMTGGRELDMGPCSQLPLGFGIFRGDFEAANLSESALLNLYYPGPRSCPGGFVASAWSFAPTSDNVTLVSLQGSGPGNATTPVGVWKGRAGADLEFWGYWSGYAPQGYPSGNVSFASFPRGNYTLVADDSWEQTALLHFQVVESASALTCSSITTDASFAASPDASAAPAGPLTLGKSYVEVGSNNTYVLSLTNAGAVPLTLPNINTGVHGAVYLFSATPTQEQTWLFFGPEGTLSYPAVFAPGQCSLLRMVLPQPVVKTPVVLWFSDNETQTFSVGP